ncbi:DUF1653 domain-containing protein [Octadecabacter sp. G9-8]|uniref:DUF1653 domain-containing protein n=1 Tax=Octadecabacter dasysiphoniae TaxID=2909341 RepID=A0ABS9D0E8_9RHOB|nr:DUF1653 domain-containing protein [Octadecabacter dasysiphoniae]MCF2872085.1 DUF1653 domain-containing protein [Octadecabacter dasysiphoniae]
MKNPFRKATEAPDAVPPSPLARAGWQPTHRHKKGGLYRLISFGTDEATRTPVAIYDDQFGTVWVRAAAEFEQVERFAPLDPSDPI